MLLALALFFTEAHAAPPPALNTCAEIDARILKRRRFLAARMQERIHLGPNVTSPYCLSHQDDDDCQLLSPFQDQRDLSRDVSELEQKADAGPPDTDPVIVPLIRKRNEHKCPGEVPQLPSPPPSPAPGP